MAQFLGIGFLVPFTNSRFIWCAIYFDSKVTRDCWEHIYTGFSGHVYILT